ncbi:hypothetical protein CDIK_1979, partial [Cucumispora dikerogammari]
EKKNFAFLYCSLAIVVYWICDGLDGKQARKTKTSSPLGQCFDHTADSLVTSMIGLMLLETFKIDDTKTVFKIILMSCYNFSFYSLKEKYTKHFTLGYINPPNEGILFCCLMFVFKGLKSQGLERSTGYLKKILFKSFMENYTLFEAVYEMFIFYHIYSIICLFLVTKAQTFTYLNDITTSIYIISFCVNQPNMFSRWNILSATLLFSTLNLEFIISNINNSDTKFPYMGLQSLLFIRDYKHAHIISCITIVIWYVHHIVLTIKEFEICLNIKWNSTS